MEHEDSSGSAVRKGVATNVVDAVVAAVLLVIGIVVIVESRRLGAGWTSDGPGSGYFPFYIGVIITISALGIFYQAILGKNKNTEVFVDKEQLKRVLSVLLPATVYVLGISLIGIYVASAIYIALFMIILGKFSWVKSVIAALAVNVLFFLMFEVWFKVPLFKGKLDPLAFLGY
ncbi:tripartite tricarboxylate transporter TctB family protein [Variovorax sp. J22R133]|uniref:tripartite tricarboxylate transporter TctB family protein n=1 Tax=Variovorax brevis TaxID=3053503 RepID=UPI0025784A12|nr:tripartite tricarboxylate transporter TctB family protein [Variovorax sp. J22R133]MDM0114194.1 tripartite tricarboxylate transporter TctB family protein [Variovorax sp. J22R133]